MENRDTGWVRGPTTYLRQICVHLNLISEFRTGERLYMESIASTAVCRSGVNPLIRSKNRTVESKKHMKFSSLPRARHLTQPQRTFLRRCKGLQITLSKQPFIVSLRTRCRRHGLFPSCRQQIRLLRKGIVKVVSYRWLWDIARM